MNRDASEALGRRIRSQRELRRLSQTALASVLQVSPQAVSSWERGENGPDLSLLVPLARALGTSVDWLLGYSADERETFEATVFVSAIRGYTQRSRQLEPRELLTWTNGLLYQVTEAVLGNDGIPVKYIGDGFLAFFAGHEHADRAIEAARATLRTVSEPVNVGLNTGPIHLGACGHPEYARIDILGGAVNLCFRVQQWAGGHGALIAATSDTVRNLSDDAGVGPAQEVVLKGIDAPVGLCVIDPV